MFSPTPSILITDDDRDFRETLSCVLAPHGFRTLEADDGEQALQLLGKEEVHLVLLDNHMPRLSGVETLRLVRKMKQHLPCILLSAALDEEIRQQAHLARAFSILSKPVTREEITRTVNQALTTTYGWWPEKTG